MSVGFFEIVFACNARTTIEECEECRYEEICDKFQMCFETSPDMVWSKVTSHEELLNCIDKWGGYQNGKTNEQ